LCAISGSKAEIHQGVKRFVPNEIDTAAVTPITAIWAATFNIFLAPETQAAATTVSCFYLYAGFIDEFHNYGILWVSSLFLKALLKKAKKSKKKSKKKPCQ
jgi:hypothetical protein